MLVHIKTIIRKAKQGSYAIGAFNFYNFETLAGIIGAAVKMKSPIIIQVSEEQVKYMGVESVVAMVKATVKTFSRRVPVTLHLDHGYDPKIIFKCINAGFSSVHADGSYLSWEKNIKLTKKVVEYAHERDIWVQGELGSILGKEGFKKHDNKYLYEATLTDPAKAREFVKLTMVDALAVSVGALHGIYRGRERIDFKRLGTIKKLISVPIVMHGASGLPRGEIKKAVQMGVKIFNIATETREAYWLSARKSFSKKDETYNLRKVSIFCQKAVGKKVEWLLKLLGSKNKA